MSSLLPSNRKLRHLEGLSLRNLTLTKPTGRPRTRTIDDDSLPTTLSSPGKLLAQRESLKLEHSRSSTDLKSQGLDGAVDFKDKKEQNGTVARPTRTTLGRRSTLNWAHESPVSREKILEDAVAERRLDSFFSLHELGKGKSEPFYISEVKEKFMNPDFKFFNPNDFEPQVSRADAMTVKVFARVPNTEKYSLLLESDVYTATLVRIGKTLDNFLQPFPDNCLIFHMSDGTYTSFFEIPNVDISNGKAIFNPIPTPRTATFQPVSTSSFDSLLKLKNLAECIDDAVKTRNSVSKQIEDHIKENERFNGVIVEASAANAKSTAVEHAMKQTKREVQKLRSEKDAIETRIEERREALRNAHLALEEEKSKLAINKEDLELQVQALRQTIKATSGQVRRIAQQLLDIFPIEPIEGKPLCFTILGHHLPNAKTFENEVSK